MHTRKRTGWLLVGGFFLMLVALVLQTITLASQDYRTVLVVALMFTALADCCFIVAFMRGGIAARVTSVILMLPTVFVVADFLRRAASSFS